MRVVTWNVNGIRAREAQVAELLEAQRPDVLCLQEIKAAAAQIPTLLLERPDYWSVWYGEKAYSGVSIHLSKAAFPEQPTFTHPAFDFETRVLVAEAGNRRFATIYVPNGGKDYEAKLRFLSGLKTWTEEEHAAGHRLVLCGDLNVALTDRDVHPKELKPGAIGQRDDERAIMRGMLDGGLSDLGRALDPDNDRLFTWWAPWRNMRERNIGWRIDYVLASAPLLPGASASTVHAKFGTSDHAPLAVEIDVQA